MPPSVLHLTTRDRVYFLTAALFVVAVSFVALTRPSWAVPVALGSLLLCQLLYGQLDQWCQHREHRALPEGRKGRYGLYRFLSRPLFFTLLMGLGLVADTLQPSPAAVAFIRLTGGLGAAYLIAQVACAGGLLWKLLVWSALTVQGLKLAVVACLILGVGFVMASLILSNGLDLMLLVAAVSFIEETLFTDGRHRLAGDGLAEVISWHRPLFVGATLGVAVWLVGGLAFTHTMFAR